MAAAAIPLALSALGTLGPLIASVATPLIKLAEAHFAPKTGASKMETVLQAVQAFLAPLATSGTIQQPVPSPAELQSIVEGVLGQLKATGQLPIAGSGAVTPSTPANPTNSISSAALKLAIGLLTTLQAQG
jgi:hypothetical protein